MVEQIILGAYSKAFPPDLIRRAELKLTQIDAAITIEDLRIPPSNNLEKLIGDRKGQHSICINKKWRVCFRWQGEDAFDVEITNHYQ